MTNLHPPTAKSRNPRCNTHTTHSVNPKDASASDQVTQSLTLTRQARPQHQPRHYTCLPSSLQAPHRLPPVLLETQAATLKSGSLSTHHNFPICSSMEDEN
ncbi:hypothetical protein FCV25MIE_06177 [Fagus crenata]